MNDMEKFSGTVKINEKEIEYETHFPKNWRWSCLRCGYCCRFQEIELLEDTEKNIIKNLGFLGKRYDELGEHFFIKIEDGKRCPFLINHNVCKIYNKRPVLCRAFPFKILRDFLTGKIKVFINLSCPAVNHPKSKPITERFLKKFIKSQYSLMSKRFVSVRKPFDIDYFNNEFMKTPLYVKPTEVFFTLHEILKRSFKDEDFLFSFRRRCWVYSNFYMNSYRVKILNREDSLFVIDTSEGLFFLYKDEHPPEINLNHFFKESIVTGTEIEKEEIYPYYITLSENRLNINYLEKKPSSTILIDKSIFEKPFSEKAKSRANSYLDYIIDHPSFQSNIIYSLIENLPDILMPCVVGLVKLEKILNTFYLVAVICSIKNNHKIVEEDDVQEAIRFLDSHLLMGLYYNKLFS